MDIAVKTAIHQANIGDYAKLYGMFRSDVKKTTTADKLEALFGKLLSDAGDFVAFTLAEPMSGTDKQYGDYFGAEVTAVYANEILIYDVAFDKDMKMVGFYATPSEEAVDENLISVVYSAEAAIGAINSGDYETVYDMFRDDARTSFTADKIKATFEPYISPAGDFVAFLEPTAENGTDKKYGDYVELHIPVQYASRDLEYSIVVDPDMQLLSLSVI